MRRTNRMRFSALLLAAVLLCTACGGGEGKAATMRLTHTAGTVDVLNEKGKTVSLQENLGLFSGYQVGTQSGSFAWIDLDQVKLAKMDEDSEVEISKEGKQLEIQLQSGGLFFNVTEPLADDETMEIRTSTMVVGIRGTCGWVEIGPDYVRAGLLEGEVECRAVENDAAGSVMIQAGMMATLRDGVPEFQVEILTADDIPDFIWGESDEILEALLAEAEAAGSQGDGQQDAAGGKTGGDEEVYFDPEEGLELPEIPDDGIERTVVEANDSDELSALFSGGNLSNTEIHLNDGTYDIGYFSLYGYENLSIIGTGETRLVVDSGEEEILMATECDNLLVYGLVMGHDIPKEVACSAGVFIISRSENVRLAGCDIYGCGLVGISGYGGNLTVQNTVIRDCSSCGVEWMGGGNVRFENCAFSGNGGEALFNIWNSGAAEPVTTEFTLENCIFQSNNCFEKCYFSEEDDSITWNESGSLESGNRWQQ